MCSIMGYIGSCVSFSAFKAAFDMTLSRGPDMSRIIELHPGYLGFHRLSIMDLSEDGMQPFALDGSYAVCNGELYGFEKEREKLSGKYSFESRSDCEIILPMYREYGTDMFAMLDAEFAMIIYDAGTGGLVAARDPIGIRPLYYGYDAEGEIIFAGQSLVSGPDGGLLFKAGGDEALLIVDVPLEKAAQERAARPWLSL